jgi:hypothetical protein
VGIDSKLNSVALQSIFAKKLPFLVLSYYFFQASSISLNFTFLSDLLDCGSFGFPSFLHAFSAAINPLWLSASSYCPSPKLVDCLGGSYSSLKRTYFCFFSSSDFKIGGGILLLD